MFYKTCHRPALNPGPLVQEATSLSTVLQPLPPLSISANFFYLLKLRICSRRCFILIFNEAVQAKWVNNFEIARNRTKIIFMPTNEQSDQMME